VRQVGEHSFRVAQRVVDEVVVVDNDEICAAIKDVFDDTRSIMEPAGALAVAGVKRWVAERGVSGAELVAVLSGANMNFDRLRFVAERAELGESREALLAVTIPERPGAFLDLSRTLGRRVVTEFNYRLSTRAEAHIVVGVGVSSRSDAAAVTEALAANGYTAIDLSDNELAKLHIRHMVGGPTAEARDEVLYRFEFPERPGALLGFLEALGGRWNISLFHYRNHGSDYGRVLAGFEVPPAERDAFAAVLDDLGYPHHAESDNPVYRAFLSSSG
jgi:threonine dehydratase